MSQAEPDTSTQAAQTAAPPADPSEAKGKGKVAVVAAGTGAAVAGLAGGIAVAARDSRRRVLGVPVGRRSRVQQTASSVVGAVQEPVRKVGSRFSRE